MTHRIAGAMTSRQNAASRNAAFFQSTITKGTP